MDIGLPNGNERNGNNNRGDGGEPPAFAYDDNVDNLSFEDSDRFEDDFEEEDSFQSEPESVCNNWRGWRKPTTSDTNSSSHTNVTSTLSRGASTGNRILVTSRHHFSSNGASSSRNYRSNENPIHHPVLSTNSQINSNSITSSTSNSKNIVAASPTNDLLKHSSNSLLENELSRIVARSDGVATLMNLSAMAVASQIPFEIVEKYELPIPENVQLLITYWSFPDNEEDVRLYSCLTNGSAEEFTKGELYFKSHAVKEPLQIGFHLTALVIPPPGLMGGGNTSKGQFNVTIVFDRRRITTCSCTCSATAKWCAHVVALCLVRIRTPSLVSVRVPVSETLSQLNRYQLLKFAQYLISEVPQQILPTAQRILDDLLSSKPSAMNTVYGAPDPTAGASAHELTAWCLDEGILKTNIHKALSKFIQPSPMVFSDVNGLCNSGGPPAATEWVSLLRPLRSHEPEGIWNLFGIIRELFLRHDSNVLQLLEILTMEIINVESILVWWFFTKVSWNHSNSANGGLNTPYGSRGNYGGGPSVSVYTQHAASSLCDELVVLWKLLVINPSLSPQKRMFLYDRLHYLHSKVIEIVRRARNSVHPAGTASGVGNTANAGVGGGNNATGNQQGGVPIRKGDIEMFIGFKPAIEMALLCDWSNCILTGIVHHSIIRSHREKQLRKFHDSRKKTVPQHQDSRTSEEESLQNGIVPVVVTASTASNYTKVGNDSATSSASPSMRSFSGGLLTGGSGSCNSIDNNNAIVPADVVTSSKRCNDGMIDDKKAATFDDNYNDMMIHDGHNNNNDNVNWLTSKASHSHQFVNNDINDNHGNREFNHLSSCESYDASGNDATRSLPQTARDLADMSNKRLLGSHKASSQFRRGVSSSSDGILDDDSNAIVRSTSSNLFSALEAQILKNNNNSFSSASSSQQQHFSASSTAHGAGGIPTGGGSTLNTARSAKDEEPNVFAGISERISRKDLRGIFCESLFAHGYLEEAIKIAKYLAQDFLVHPPTGIFESVPIPRGKRKKAAAIAETNAFSWSILGKATFLVTVLMQSRETLNLAFRLGLFALEMPRIPCSSRTMEVKLAWQEDELMNHLRVLPLSRSEIGILRARAELLRMGVLRSRGDAYLPLTLTTFIFDALTGNTGAAAMINGNDGDVSSRDHQRHYTNINNNNTRYNFVTQEQQTISSSSAQHDQHHHRDLFLPTPDDINLAFEASVTTLSLKANVSEAEHPLLCEGIRRQRGDLALVLLYFFRDDQDKLSIILDRLLDKEIHQKFRVPPLSACFVPYSSVSSGNVSSNNNVSSSSVLFSNNFVPLTNSSSSRPMDNSSDVPSSVTSRSNGLADEGGQVLFRQDSAFDSVGSSSSHVSEIQNEVVDSPTKRTIIEQSNTTRLNRLSLGNSGELAISGGGRESSVSGSSLSKRPLGGGSSKSSLTQQPSSQSNVVTRPRVLFRDRRGEKDTDSSALEEDSDTTTQRFRTSILRNTKKQPSIGMAAIDSSAPETTSSDNSPTIVRRRFPGETENGSSSDGGGNDSVSEEPITTGVNREIDLLSSLSNTAQAMASKSAGIGSSALADNHVVSVAGRSSSNSCESMRSDSSGVNSAESASNALLTNNRKKQVDYVESTRLPFTRSSTEIGGEAGSSSAYSTCVTIAANISRNSTPNASIGPTTGPNGNMSSSYYTPVPYAVSCKIPSSIVTGGSRHKTKNRMPIVPNQPSEALAHSMFELAKTVLSLAGGNSASVSIFTENRPRTLHRNLHLASFQIGLYALGLHNCVTPNWLSRTYSGFMSWVTGQAMDIGAPALNILIESWEGHLTPTEVTQLADKASRGLDNNTTQAAARLALSCLPHAHALNPNEISRSIAQCREQSQEMLESACYAIENAARDYEVYPEVLFEVANEWYYMYEKVMERERGRLRARNPNEEHREEVTSTENNAAGDGHPNSVQQLRQSVSSRQNNTNNNTSFYIPEPPSVLQFSHHPTITSRSNSMNVLSNYPSTHPPTNSGSTTPNTSLPSAGSLLPTIPASGLANTMIQQNLTPQRQLSRITPPSPMRQFSNSSPHQQPTIGLIHPQSQQCLIAAAAATPPHSGVGNIPQSPFGSSTTASPLHQQPVYSNNNTTIPPPPVVIQLQNGQQAIMHNGQTLQLIPQPSQQPSNLNHFQHQQQGGVTQQTAFVPAANPTVGNGLHYSHSQPHLSTQTPQSLGNNASGNMMQQPIQTVPSVNNSFISYGASTATTPFIPMNNQRQNIQQHQQIIVSNATTGGVASVMVPPSGNTAFLQGRVAPATNIVQGQLQTPTTTFFVSQGQQQPNGINNVNTATTGGIFSQPQGHISTLHQQQLVVYPQHHQPQQVAIVQRSNSNNVSVDQQSSSSSATNQHHNSNTTSLPVIPTEAMNYLLSCYRVGMLAMETLAKRIHDERPQCKYGKNPPMSHDIKFLLTEVTFKLELSYLQQFCTSVVNAVLSPWLLDELHDAIRDHLNRHVHLRHLRGTGIELIQLKNVQMCKTCALQRGVHMTLQDYDDFYRLILLAHKVYMKNGPSALSDLKDLLMSVKKVKSVKRELWEKIRTSFNTMYPILNLP